LRLRLGSGRAGRFRSLKALLFDPATTMRYADIVLPLAQPLYTFAVAEGVTLCEGMAVVVPFGRSKIYTGIVWRLHDRRPDFKTVKTVSRVLYGTPLLDERQRRFWAGGGGTLVIDPCEAMTVIDVNTAKFTGKRELEDTVLRLNLEACGEIARQVRLRNLSGIIIIDMIDMKTPEHRQMVLDALEEAFASDRVKTVIHGLTSLGLVEMTRKRSRPPLREMLAKQEEAHE